MTKFFQTANSPDENIWLEVKPSKCLHGFSKSKDAMHFQWDISIHTPFARSINTLLHAAYCHLIRFFFSSSMADVALWLGPYMSISSKNVICTRTEKARKCRQITTNQPSHRPARRPANPPARLAFRQRKQQTRHTKRGKSPNKNTHKKICHRTQWSDHCITLKNMHTMN